MDLEEVLKEHEANQRRPAAGRLQSGVLIRPKQRPPVSKVLLVGGATRMPTFQRFVRNMTGMTPDPSLVDPDLVSAHCCATGPDMTICHQSRHSPTGVCQLLSQSRQPNHFDLRLHGLFMGLQAVAIGAAVHAGSLGEGSGSLSQLETMDPFKKALMQAIATKQMREDEQLGRNMLGDEYEEFMRQQQKEVGILVGVQLVYASPGLCGSRAGATVAASKAETRLQDDEWSKADMDGADQEGDSSPVEGAAHSEAAESQDS